MGYRLQQTTAALLFWRLSVVLSAAEASSIELRTAAQRSAPKYFQQTESAAVQGLCVDILEAIQQQVANIRISGYQQFLPSARIYAALRSGELDLFCGSGKTLERLQQLHYLMPPLYAVQHRLVARADDPVAVNSYADLRALEDDGLVLTYLNSATHHFLLRQPGLRIDEGSNLDNLFERLLLGRGRFIYYHDLGLRHYIDKHQLAAEVRMLPAVFNRYDHYLVASPLLSKATLERLENALQVLHDSGRLEQLHRRYVPITAP